MLYNIILSHCRQNMKIFGVAIYASSVTDMGQTCLLGHLLKVSKTVIYRASQLSGERCSQPEHVKRKVICEDDRSSTPIPSLSAFGLMPRSRIKVGYSTECAERCFFFLFWFCLFPTNQPVSHVFESSLVGM